MKNVVTSVPKRVLTSLIAVAMLFGFCSVGELDASATQSQKGNFNTNYTLTGDGATDILNVAKAQIGRTGSSFGYTESWCADFVSDCAELAGQSSAVPRHGHVDYLTSNLLNAGGTKYTTQASAKAGDIVFYDFNANNSPDHVEIVSYVSGGKIYSVGGNTSYVNSVSTSKVSNERYCGSFLYFIRPNYTVSTPTPAPVIDPDIGYPEPTRILSVQSPYMTGDDVRWVQKALSMLGYSISIDGYYGNDTKSVVASFQSNNGLTADGIVGTQTRGKIKECIQLSKFNPVDLGTEFYALIVHNGKVVEQKNDNVVLATESGYRNQLWYFERVDGLYYRITNSDNNKCLDADCSGTEYPLNPPA